MNQMCWRSVYLHMKLARVCSGLLAALLLAGCSASPQSNAIGSCPNTKAFELSLVSAYGGQKTPVAAANHARVSGVTMPTRGWRIVSQHLGV